MGTVAGGYDFKGNWAAATHTRKTVVIAGLRATTISPRITLLADDS